MGDEPGFRDLIAAIMQMADAVDRLTTVVEELAIRVGVPTRDHDALD